MTHGVSFPLQVDAEGRTSRPTTPVGRDVVAAALAAVDPVGARAAEHETAWRSRYLAHYRRLVEAGLPTAGAWTAIARAGLAAVHERLVVADDDGDRPLPSLLDRPAGRQVETREVRGERPPLTALELPYRGQLLAGPALLARLDAWERAGVLEPSAAQAVREVAAHPDWLRLEGHTVAVLGAGAEMGPLGPLLRWGASVAAVDLPSAAIWARVRAAAGTGAGRLLMPVVPGSEDAGIDLLAQVPEAADWLAGMDGRLVLGNYLYADGGTHVRVSAAADVLGLRLARSRPDMALAFLATPTDVFAVPAEAVERSVAAYDERTRLARTLGRPLRWMSRGRLLHRQYPPASVAQPGPGICDCLVPQQGPSYALAKRLQRWRASAALTDGRTVSFHVAPATRTRSVVKNRALAAAFAGAHRFGVEVFDPSTANTLMAVLLVHDLMGAPRPATAHPWEDEAYAAVHGGLWRAPYEPRSALGLAAVLGYAGSRG